MFGDNDTEADEDRIREAMLQFSEACRLHNDDDSTVTVDDVRGAMERAEDAIKDEVGCSDVFFCAEDTVIMHRDIRSPEIKRIGENEIGLMVIYGGEDNEENTYGF